VLCASRYVADTYQASGVPAGSLHVLPYGVPLGVQPAPPPAQPTVLFLARLIPHKGADQVIRAFALVPDPARLVVAGTGPELPKLRELAQRLDLGRRVRFLEEEGTGRKLYPSASLVVVPSLWPEPFGLVGPEAMAQGRPVVAYRVGGIPEWLPEGEVGYLVEPGDVVGMADRITKLLSDPSLARRMGRAGRALVDRRYTVPRYVDALVDLLQEVSEPRLPLAAGS
jgi:glycosyltransferase involved in cell wall biosynthesis